ncbi:syntaxin-11-like [Lepisosteus oculatus]|uniref:syntaxin-11-like n=1 Tax=Lepisosteus oculatus TaxID=7918 RepID=UPI0003EAC23B|nr:PREDICTED: syntaxin-11-like [Lepisosteus oculatus]XP_015202504.1 PREDICTED: syntaxin-11-like [Lepisosteus oculatus]XP_015202512.1 PREDICTED: syntaxin-11-like [Lepisosteus oculatus]XP_015202520.1 PREDICTED: syntaxin-11-like [Lepisosteus oculatus]XP_015202525.1 PREDICTED: syntaxin-11-like [Lepisosteus oculatus]XP_015202538.1 PREDICTED: syntaxin-11-like [Lepisosteus oculatus]XP_015202541.1 PREDICTED: syntaxin-11-like [Lepisosteus oculatus]
MRDRIGDMKNLVKQPPEAKESCSSEEKKEVPDTEQALNEVLLEVQDVRKEIQLIREDVMKLNKQHAQMLTNVSTESLDKCNAIASDIKNRGQDVLTKLQKMEAHSKELEAKYGANSATARISRTQYASLSNSFRDVIFDYNEAEMTHKEKCKNILQRQLEVIGKEVTGEEIEEMLDSGKLSVFTDNVLVEGKTARSAFNEIENRHKELMDLEQRIKSVHELFLDVAMLAEEQGAMQSSIEASVHKTDSAIGEVLTKLNAAKKYKNNNPFKRICCGCFPCMK